MFEFLLLVLSLLFIFGSISWLIEDLDTTDVGKNFYALLLTYLIPSTFVLVAGFLSILTKEIILCFSFLMFLVFLIKKRKIPKFKCFHINEEINFPITCVLILISYFLIKASLGTVWISLDDSTYHAAIPMLWVKYNSFYVPELTYQAPFPLAGSLFSTFFMVFVRNEYVSSISEVLILLIAIFTVRHFCRERKIPILPSLILIPLYFSSADVIKYLKGFSDSDIISGILITALLVVLLTKKEKVFYYLISGVLFGFLMSIKLTNAVILIPFLFFVYRSLKNSKRANIFYATVSAIIICIPWYVRNLIVYSNPFAPFEKYGFKGAMSKNLISETSLKGIWENIDYAEKISVLKGFLGWQPFSWVMSTFVFICLIISFLSKDSRKNSFGVYNIASLGFFVLVFVGAPFSGLNESLNVNENSSRYLLSWYFMTLFFSLTSLFEIKNISKNITSLLFVLVLIPFFFLNITDKVLLLSTVFSLVVFAAKKIKLVKELSINTLIPFFCVVFLSFFVGAKKTETSKNETIWYLEEINKIKSEKRVSMFDGFIFRGFYLSGDKFKHVPIRQNFDGSKVSLNEVKDISRKYFFRGEPISKKKDFCDNFLKNSLDLKIDIFIFGKKPDGSFPEQYCDVLKTRFLVLHESNDGHVLVKRNSKTGI